MRVKEISVQPRDDSSLAGLARRGLLASTFAAADKPERRGMLRALYAIAWPIVFTRITRPAEAKRGHKWCAKGFGQLMPECADRFHDDVAAVIHEVFRRATAPIGDLEAWIAGMARNATVDAHRRRRGAINALQRPRLPLWLGRELGHDRWLTRLAVHVLEWVGVPATAGASLWPLDSWTDRRAEVTADWQGSTPEVVAHEVETVLAAMRTRARWFADHVEEPLGHKQSPAAIHPDPFPPLPLTGREEAADAELAGAAHDAVRAISARIEAGEEPGIVVPEVVRRLFCDGLTAGESAEWLADELLDDAGTERVVTAVLQVIEGIQDIRRTG